MEHNTPTPDGGTEQNLSDAQYRQAAEAMLAGIDAQVDQWLQDDTVDIDASRSGGMLTMTLPNRSQVIVSMQPPLRELWIAARSGGFHFRWAGSQNWLDTRSGEPFLSVLSACLSEQSGLPLKVAV